MKRIVSVIPALSAGFQASVPAKGDVYAAVAANIQESKMHPKQAEVMKKAQEKKAIDDMKTAAIQNRTVQLKLKYTHIRPTAGITGAVENRGGMTIAYRLATGGGDIVELATALVHPNDTFYKKEGRYRASLNFSNGHTTKLRVRKGYGPAHFLQSLFVGFV